MLRLTGVLCIAAVVCIGACGDDGGSNNADGGPLFDGDGSLIDGDGSVIPPPVDFDGGPISGGADCQPDSTECNNCVDDDDDGQIDGADFECISPLDDDESSFATGIPGDNKDAKKQDCFFDGDSGAGNDGCNIDICCILDSCQPSGSCTLTTKCIENCGPLLTPPGCDCFGCCTFCEGGNCYDVIVNPAVAPDCDETVISDPNLCPTCTKQTTCGPEDCANPDDCILCPGQDESDLPASCGGENECANGEPVCDTTADCPENRYCTQGCCSEGFVVD